MTGFNAKAGQAFLQNLGTDRAREGTAAGGPAVGLIQADQHRNLRVFNGRHRHKAGNAGPLIFAVQFLAGAGLAAHAVARHCGIFAGT